MFDAAPKASYGLSPDLIRAHVEIIHKLAAPLAGQGKLVIAAFGEDPNKPNPKTGASGYPLPPLIEHVAISDVEKTVSTICKLAKREHYNVYMPLAVFQIDLPVGKKGFEKQSVAVLGLVADFDDRGAERWAARLPLPPNYVLETSTGRFQTFYFFENPEATQAVKPVAKQLRDFAGCDHGTLDLSHVWRIAGSLNWPNAKKVAAGRSRGPQLVRVIKPWDQTTVLLEALVAASPAQTHGKTAWSDRTNGAEHNTDHTARDAHVGDEGVGDHDDTAASGDTEISVETIIKMLPRKLRDRITEPASGDRSRDLYYVVRALIERDLDDLTVERIIRHYPRGIGAKYVNRTDLDAEIARVRGKTAAGRKMRGNAAKFDEQVTAAEIAAEIARSRRALEQVITDFNARYSVVNEAGKVWIFEWRLDPVLSREVLDRISHADFRRLYENDRLEVFTKEGKKITKTRAEWWLKHRARCQYLKGVTFDPTSQAPPGYMNLWRGFAVEPKPGDWSLLRDHIEKVICCGVTKHFCYVLDWMARLVQYPSRPGEVAIVVRGKKGCGKGIFGRWVAKAYGQHGMQIFNPAQLVGRFNEHLRDCVLLFGDEAFYAGDKQHESVLKGLITEPFLPIEGKYQRVITVANMLHILLASNHDWVIPASVDERRFAVFDVADNRCGDIPYFAAIDRQMNKGGLAAMLHDLLTRDISGFEVRDAPLTEALKIQKTLSLSSLEKWWLAVLSRGFVWKSRHGANYFRDWHPFYTTELLYRSYVQWCQESRPFDRKSREELGRFMTTIYSPRRPRQESHPVYELDSIDGEGIKAGKPIDQASIVWQDRPHGYWIGELEEARVRFTEICDVLTEWGLEP